MRNRDRGGAARVWPVWAWAALTAAMLAEPALAAPTTTPAGRYDRDRTCAAVTTSGVSLPHETAQKTQALATLYAERIQVSGKAVDRTPEQISLDVDQTRKSILAGIHSPDPERARTEIADASSLKERCAALPIFEMFTHNRSS